MHIHLFDVDKNVDDSVIDKLASIEGIIKVRVVK